MRHKSNQNSQPKEHKTFAAFQLKIDEAQGIAEEIVAVMGNCDQGDDVIHPGAFSKTIQERASKIKVLDQHGTDSIMRILGKPLAMRELAKGELPQQLLDEYPEATGALAVTTKYFLDTPEGKGAFARVKEGMVEYSIGYDAQDIDYSKITLPDGKTKTVRNLRTIKLYEYSPVLWGMNSATMTVSAKAEPTTTPPAGKSINLTERVRDVEMAFCELFNMSGMMDFFVREVFDDHLIACRIPRSGRKEEYYSVPYNTAEGVVNFAPEDAWTLGTYVFTPTPVSAGANTATMSASDEPTEAKAGRVLSRRNAEAMRRAMLELMEIMRSAGMMDEEDEDEEDMPHDSGKSSIAPATSTPTGAADLRDNEQAPKGDTQAGPPKQAPTEDDLNALIDLERVGLDLFKLKQPEVRS